MADGDEGRVSDNDHEKTSSNGVSTDGSTTQPFSNRNHATNMSDPNRTSKMLNEGDTTSNSASSGTSFGHNNSSASSAAQPYSSHSTSLSGSLSLSRSGSEDRDSNNEDSGSNNGGTGSESGATDESEVRNIIADAQCHGGSQPSIFAETSVDSRPNSTETNHAMDSPSQERRHPQADERYEPSSSMNGLTSLIDAVHQRCNSQS